MSSIPIHGSSSSNRRQGTEIGILQMKRMFTYLQCLWQSYSFRAWGPEKDPLCQSVSQSVSQAVKLLKAYYLEYAPVIHPEKVASRKHVGNGPTPPWVTTYRHLHAHRFNRYSVLIPFINLPSRNCFRGIDDKCEIGTVIRVLYNVSKAAVTAVTQ